MIILLPSFYGYCSGLHIETHQCSLSDRDSHLQSQFLAHLFILFLKQTKANRSNKERKGVFQPLIVLQCLLLVTWAYHALCMKKFPSDPPPPPSPAPNISIYFLPSPAFPILPSGLNSDHTFSRKSSWKAAFLRLAQCLSSGSSQTCAFNPSQPLSLCTEIVSICACFSSRCKTLMARDCALLRMVTQTQAQHSA